MDQVFDGLKATVGGVHREMKNDLDVQKTQIDAVDSTIRTLGTIKYVLLDLCQELIKLIFRGKAVFLLRNLEQFASSYLRSDSPPTP